MSRDTDQFGTLIIDWFVNNKSSFSIFDLLGVPPKGLPGAVGHGRRTWPRLCVILGSKGIHSDLITVGQEITRLSALNPLQVESAWALLSALARTLACTLARTLLRTVPASLLQTARLIILGLRRGFPLWGSSHTWQTQNILVSSRLLLPWQLEQPSFNPQSPHFPMWRCPLLELMLVNWVLHAGRLPPSCDRAVRASESSWLPLQPWEWGWPWWSDSGGNERIVFWLWLHSWLRGIVRRVCYIHAYCLI